MNRPKVEPLALGVLGILAFGIYRFLNPAPPNPGNGPAGQVNPAANDPRPATFTIAQAVALANGFFAAVYGGFFGEDEAVMVHILQQCKVGSDVAMLMNAYGTRETVATMELDLSGAVINYLSADDIAKVNANYRAKSIPFQF